MALGTEYAQQDCSLARTLEVVGERWTLLILRDCFLGVRRFADFEAHLDISKAVLTQRLATLVDAGLLETVPRGRRHDYVLTDRGRSLWPVLFTMTQWGEEHLAPEAGVASSSTGRVPRSSSRAVAARRAVRSRDPRRSTRTRGRAPAGCATTRCRVELRGRRPLLAPVGRGLPHLDSNQEPAD